MADERQILESLFADLRAEWPQDQFESLFIRPSYFDKLIGKRPCLLFGGRGTGKTTSLRSLRFDGAASQTQCNQAQPAYLGVYLRFNKNRVRAFGGDGLSSHDWDHAFAHYFNLLACQEMCRLVEWLTSAGVGAESPDLAHVSRSFGLAPDCRSVSDLSAALEEQIVQLELFVNNPLRVTRPLFSMSEAPLKQFVTSLEKTGNLKAGQTVFCCLDEYENLTEGQQSIINTYIKHSEPPLTYKIGVRRNGLRTRSTIDASDQIVTPDDYAEIDIGTENFADFARSVANLRLNRAKEQGVNLPVHIGEFLDEMDFAKEAELLGAHRVAEDVRREIEKANMPELDSWCSVRPDKEVYFLGFWAAGHEESVVDLAKEWMKDPVPRVVPVIGVPGFRVEYPFVTVACNQEFLTDYQAHSNVRIARASCPFEAYDALDQIRSDYPGSYVYLAPIGTKPHALGAVWFAIDHPAFTEIMYDHPVRKSQRTYGVGVVHVYCLKDDA